MTKEELMELAEKIKNNTETAEERSSFFSELENLLKELSDDLSKLKEK